MDIIEFFGSDAVCRQFLIRELRRCDWEAGKFLLKLIETDTLGQTLGGSGKLFFLTDGISVVSYLTLTVQDCIIAPDLTPWIGFVYTFPEYRGHRYSGSLLDHACRCAALSGASSVFLATDHIGLYEKYGFAYLENRLDVYGETSRIYVRKTS